MPPRKPRSALTTAARRSQRKVRSTASISAAAAEAPAPPKQPIRPRPRPRPPQLQPQPGPSSCRPPSFSPEPKVINEEMGNGSDAGGPESGGGVDELDEWDATTNIEPLELSDEEDGPTNAFAFDDSEPEVIEEPEPDATTAVRGVLSESEQELLPTPRGLHLSSSSPDSSPILFPVDKQVKPALKAIKQESKMKARAVVSKPGRGNKASKPVPDVENSIDDSDLVVPKMLVCFVQAEGGLKRHEFDMEINFETFQYHISNILKVPTWELALTYSMCTMKRGDRCFVSDEGEFTSMIHEARGFYNQQISIIRGKRLKDAAAVHNAQTRGRIYVPKPTKQIPNLNLTIYNKPPTTEKGAKGKAVDTSSGVKIEGLSARTLRIRGELEKKDCSECRQPCVLVPNADGKPIHKSLGDSHLDLWADHVARGLCTTQRPPPALVLSLTDAPPRTRNRDCSQAAPTVNPPVPTPAPSYPPASSNGPLAPPQYPPYPHTLGAMPPLHGYPAPFYPPAYNMPPAYYSNSPYNIPFDIHPHPYAHNYTPFPYSYQNPSFTGTPRPTLARHRTTSPWLLDWLPLLDAGERGNFGDNFGSLAAGFAAVGILELIHLRDFTEDDIQQIAFLTPAGSVFYISPATASRLIQYVQEDLSVRDFF